MNRITRKNIRRALSGAVAFIALATAATTASAQVYMHGFGGTGTDASRGGVLSMPNGDAVIVGETNSHFPGNYDVYLIRAGSCGDAIWGQHYDLGGDDRAHKIRSTPDGGFIIVGETQNTANCCLHNDIFLLKVDSIGTVEWARTYGGSGEEMGSDVQLTGDGYAVAGRSNSFGQGDDDGYLMVTDLNGGLIWARVYGGPDIDIFLSCAVAPDNGDIIATGGTRSFTIDGNTDLWLTRVFQANGLPITPGMPVTYGGDGNDIGWSVLVCTNGDVAVAGGTASAGGFGEGYLLRTTNMLLPLCDRTYGGANSVPGEWDEFLELKEVDASKFVVTGLFFNPTFGFGDFDMFVGEFGPCFDKISGVVHGGPRNDQGWSVAVAQGAPSPQYLVGGLTESFTSSMDMYLVRQLANGTSACSTRVIETRSTVPHFPAVSVKAVTARVNANCEVTVRPRAEYTEYLICSDCNRHNLRTPRGGEENLDPNVEAPTIGMGGRHEAPPAATTISTPGTMNYNR